MTTKPAPTVTPSASGIAAPAASPGLDALLARGRARRADGEPAWLAPRRAEALARVASRGLPTSRDEAWKYTNLAPLARTPWRVAAAASPDALRALVERHRLHLVSGVSLVVVDGRYAPELSLVPPHAAGLEVGSLAAELRRAPDALEPHLARVASGGDRPIADLSTACFDDGVLVRLVAGTCLPVPIDVLHVSTGGGAASFPRTLVVAETASRVTLVERFVSAGPGPYAVLPVTEVSLARNAAVEHVVWQEDADDAVHVATVEARQDRDSRFTSYALTLGAGLARTDTGVTLDGEGAECGLYGLYLVFGRRHADHHTRIDHAKPHGISRELYKGILDGQGTGVFNGKVIVRPGAQKTDSQQTSHTLLLSAEATADTKPELEIYADDVKCAHGATIGRLEDEKLFYLRSRGIDARAARDLLLRAFARDVADRITIEPVHARLERWITERMPALSGREESA